jgi:hypothetical protein
MRQTEKLARNDVELSRTASCDERPMRLPFLTTSR